jgi:thiamine biosynthesis lipoprotein
VTGPLPVARFRALGSGATVLVTRPDVLEEAVELATARIDAIDAACSRFRDDSELCALNGAAGRPCVVSPLLLQAVEVACRAASLTDGLVDPTVGGALIALGYDRDFRSVPPDGPVLRGSIPIAGRWREIRIDPARSTVQLPAGVQLDLGATAKALAADMAAEVAARTTGSGVLVSLGGDLAVAGEAPDGGWPILVTDDHADAPDGDGQTVTLVSGGLATSGTTVRRWRRGRVELHHLVDPRSGRPCSSCWRTVSVAAATCVDANTASTAAIVMGEAAPTWLSDRSLPARLVADDGSVTCVAGWQGPR